MIAYLIVAVAYDHVPYRAFKTRDLLDRLPSIDRRESAFITINLRRCVKKGWFTGTKEKGRWVWKLTKQGQVMGRWALTHAADFDPDVKNYVNYERNQ
tara:strand:+ start:671 stop:964 length:294 start_codon:yes stop_codon:yes gene_type:complete